MAVQKSEHFREKVSPYAKLSRERESQRIKLVADENTKFDIDLSISEGDFKNLG